MTCDQWVLCISSSVTAIATAVIACYAFISNRLAKANRILTLELEKTAREMDLRHISTLQHLAAATLAGGGIGGNIQDGVNWYKQYLKNIQEHAKTETKQ